MDYIQIQQNVNKILRIYKQVLKIRHYSCGLLDLLLKTGWWSNTT